MLHGSKITKSYGDLTVLDGLDITIHKNEIAAIVGKSGSGKSTLLHILGTLDTADQGSITIGDTDVTRLDQRQLARFRNERIGFIFQFHHLLAEFTALENVCLPAYINGAKREPTEAKAKEYLAYLGLSERLHHKPNQLSGGEQQRVAIARSLINEPDIIFADEPTGNLDDHTSEDLFQLLLRLRKDYNQTFVLVTHSNDIAARCDRTLSLSDKKLKQVA
ncbi:MAG: ABC transporter ATP-binding protein [Bacteroidota bacterium]